MQPMRPTVPANVPARAAGMLGTSGDITATVATDASALDTKPDARIATGTAAGAATGAAAPVGLDPTGVPGAITAQSASAVAKDAVQKTSEVAGTKAPAKKGAKPAKVAKTSKPKPPKKSATPPANPALAPTAPADLTAPPKQ